MKWASYHIKIPPSNLQPWRETVKVNMVDHDREVTLVFFTVRDWLKFMRWHCPSWVWKSVRHPATGMGSATVEIKCRPRTEADA